MVLTPTVLFSYKNLGHGYPVDAEISGASESVKQLRYHVAIAVGEKLFEILDSKRQGAMLREAFNHSAHSWPTDVVSTFTKPSRRDASEIEPEGPDGHVREAISEEAFIR